jgi:hypothetical protein
VAEALIAVPCLGEVGSGAGKEARGPAVAAGMSSLKYDYLWMIIGVNPKINRFQSKKV